MTTPYLEIIVRGVLIDQGRLLLCRNRKHGHLFLPGGHIDFGEPAATALEREMHEELGTTDLKAGRFLGACEASFEQQSKSGGTKRHHEINLVFELRGATAAVNPDLLVSQEDPIEFIWHPIESILSGKVPILPAGITRMLAPSTSELVSPSWITSFE